MMIISSICAFLIIFFVSFCSFYYSFCRANIYQVPAIREKIKFVISALTLRTIFLFIIWLLILQLITTKSQISDFVISVLTAFIVGAVPIFLNTAFQNFIIYLGINQDDNGSEEESVSSLKAIIKYIFLRESVIKRIMKLLELLRRESAFDFLRVYMTLMHHVNRKIRIIIFEKGLQPDFARRVNKCFERAKRLRSQEAGEPPSEYVYRLRHFSKKVHLLLEWYGWEAFNEMTKNPNIMDEFPSWNGDEARKKDLTSQGLRFFELSAND